MAERTASFITKGLQNVHSALRLIQVRPPAALITEGLGNVLLVLRFVQATSDVFPPLKSAVSGVIWIADSVKNFKSNQEDWKQFSEYVQQMVACIVCLIRKHESSTSVRGHDQVDLQTPGEFLRCNSQHYNSALFSLNETLEDIRATMTRRQEAMPKSSFRRYIAIAKDRDEINELRSKFDRALVFFHLGSITEARNELAKGINFVADELRNLFTQVARLDQRIERNEHLRNLETKHHDAQKNINRLEGADIAPWDSKGTCLDGTRVDIVNDILGFADGSNASFHEDIRVLLITGVAGSGKTTIAETARQRCEEAGLLVSSFNFVTGSVQKTPDLLITTIVRDLSRFDRALETQIGAAIAQHPRIISALINEKFHQLIQKPLSSIPIPRRMVIIIDALDEGYDENLIDILTKKCTSLPSNCRFVVTTRPFPIILNAFQVNNDTVELVKLELDNERNRDDIAVFARHELRKLGLAPWPDDSQIQALVKEAGGLFIWVATVCKYIREYSTNPIKQLQCIIEDHPSNLLPEVKLEKLYSTVLSKCPWNDPDFEVMYQDVLGAVIALRSPLSAIAIKSLLKIDPRLELSVCLRWLSPVLTGLNSQEGRQEPLQTLHPSFRRYVTQYKFCRDEIKFAIDEATHSQHLGLYSLRFLNEQLPKLVAQSVVSQESISDELRYSCVFWVPHLETVKEPCQALLTSLSEFMTNLTAWITFFEVERNFPGIGRIISWAHDVDFPIWTHLGPVAEEVSKTLHSLSWLLDAAGRWDEALIAIDGAVILRRWLATNQPEDFNKELADSLTHLCITQIQLGHRKKGLVTGNQVADLYRALSEKEYSYTLNLSLTLHNIAFIQGSRHQWEEALVPMQEAVDLRRKLAKDSSSFHKIALAESLNGLAWVLHHLVRDGDALEYSHEAVALQRETASDEDPNSFVHLASYLETLSCCLSGISEHGEALKVICEAEVILQRELQMHPVEKDIDINFALVLNKKSTCLANCNQYKDALIAIQDAVKLRRQLAKDRPASFNPELAESLLNLADRLDDLGDHDQGLRYVREAVGLWRQLVEDEPTTFGDDLAKSLNRLAVALLAVGLEDEAADTQQEAQKVRDAL